MDPSERTTAQEEVTEIFSTAPDRLRFANTLDDGALLPPGWAKLRAGWRFPVVPVKRDLDAPTASKIFMTGSGSDERITADGQRAYGHSVGLQMPVSGSSQPGGATTALTIYPDLGVVAVVLCNYRLSVIGGIGAFLAQQDQIITQETC